MSDDSDSSLPESEYYNADSLLFYNDDFSEKICCSEEEDKVDDFKSGIEELCGSTKEGFKRVDSNVDESYEESSNVLCRVDFEVGTVLFRTVEDDWQDSNDDTSFERESGLVKEDKTNKNEYYRMTDNTPPDATDFDEETTIDGTTDLHVKLTTDFDAKLTSGFDETIKEETTNLKVKLTAGFDETIKESTTDFHEETIKDGTTNLKAKLTTDFDEETIKDGTTDAKEKFEPKTLNKLRKLLLDESHSTGNLEYYIGDLLHVIESELIKLHKERKKVAKAPQGTEVTKPKGNEVIKPKKPKRKKSKVLSRYAIRSLGLKRGYHMENTEVIASSLSKEFLQIDGMIEYFRQVNADFEAEFNQPNTPLGEAKLASQRMDELFSKFKVKILVLQDSYKEVKHCLGLYVKSDKTLGEDLLRNINRYFGKSRVRNIPSVQHDEILEVLRQYNRQHCDF